MFLKISSFYFFYFATIAVYVIYLPAIMKGVGYTPFEIGVLFAAGPLSRFVAPFFFVSHFHLNRRTFYTGLGVSTVSAVAIWLFIGNFYMLLSLMVILGFFWSITLPFVEVLALETIKKENYGKSRLFGSVGFIVVGLLLGQGSLNADLALLVYIGCIVATLVSGVVLGGYIQKEITRVKAAFSQEARYALWVGLFLVQVAFGFFYNFFTIFEQSHGIPLDVISYLWSFGVLAEIIMFRIQTRVMQFDTLFLIRLSVLIGGFRWFLVYLFPENTGVLYFSQSLHAFSFALLHTASISYINAIYKNRQLAQQFYVGIVFGLGGFVGSLLSGYLYGEQIFLFAGAIMLAAWGVLQLERRPLSRI